MSSFLKLPSLLFPDIQGIAKDLDDTFNKAPLHITRRPPISANQIKEVLVITWYDMYANINTRTAQVKMKTSDESLKRKFLLRITFFSK